MSEPIPSKHPNRFLRFWRTIGGGSLTLSLFIHGAVIFVGGFVVFITRLPEKQIDFLPGGGTQAGAEASRDLAHKVQQKKRKTLSKVLPMKKLVTTSLNSTITLPDAPLDALDVPDVSSLIGGGSINGGFGKAGTGGGFGTGSGMGGLSGITFKPLMMFGKELKDTRKMAVVMDVSRSMTKFLPIVARELDKVARGSPLILYFGCGLKTPPKNLEDKVRKVSDPGFNKFWQYWEGKNDMKALRSEYPNLKFDPAQHVLHRFQWHHLHLARAHVQRGDGSGHDLLVLRLHGRRGRVPYCGREEEAQDPEAEALHACLRAWKIL